MMYYFWLCSEYDTSGIDNGTQPGVKQPVIITLSSRGNLQQAFLTVDRLINIHSLTDIAYAVSAPHIPHSVQWYAIGVPDEMRVCHTVQDIMQCTNKRLKKLVSVLLPYCY
jgi:hypothetical protein